MVHPEGFSTIQKQDLILANILAGPLMTLVEQFYQLLKPKGELLMSGILAEQENELLEKFKSHFVDFQVKRKDDWISVFAKRKD